MPQIDLLILPNIKVAQLATIWWTIETRDVKKGTKNKRKAMDQVAPLNEVISLLSLSRLVTEDCSLYSSFLRENALSKWKEKFQSELAWINLDKIIVCLDTNHSSADLKTQKFVIQCLF